MSQTKYTLPLTQTSEQRRELWAEIEKAGGIASYLREEARRQGLEVSGDPEHMSVKQRQQYKQAKRLEAEFRKALRKCTWLAYRETHLVHLGDGIFYNDLIDFDAFDIEKRDQRLAQNGIPALENVDALAQFLGVTVSQLRWLSYHRNAETQPHYVQFTIPKANGSLRIISAPKRRLKACQHKILRHILSPLAIHGAAHGFVPGRSIATHAEKHAGSALVVKMDLQQFFPTIVFPRVKGFFRKIGYPEQVATVLALLCTEAPRQSVEHQGKTFHVALQDRCLPQGAPTSPTLTNLLCVRMDRRISGLARKLGWKYSRYADDLAFSWHQDADATISTLLRFTQKIIHSEGFQVHPTKTKVMRDGNRQIITSLVLNPIPGETSTHPRPTRTLIRQLRAAIHKRQNNLPGKEGETLEQLLGLAAFVCQSNPKRGRPMLQQIKELMAAQDSSASSV